MIPPPVVVLHGVPLFEVTLLEYLFRVALHLFAFGGIAVVVSRGLGVVSAVRAGVVDRRDGGEDDTLR